MRVSSGSRTVILAAAMIVALLGLYAPASWASSTAVFYVA
jgi:hypothetical protein